MKQRLKQFYESFGDRGVMFILYALTVVINTLCAITSELPTVYPDEIRTAGTAALFSGRNWSALSGQLGNGYIQALLYAPLFWFIKNPYVLYKAMLIVNALIVGFIPLIAYRLAGKFGVMQVRRKLLIALCCGMYATYITNSKFIWNETITCFFGWLLTLCIFSTWDKRNRSSRAAMSLLTGFLCAVSYAANKRLIAVVAALVLTVIIARFVFKEKILNLPVFGITLCVSFAAEHFLRLAIEQALCGAEAGGTEVIAASANAAGRFFGMLFSHIYAFMTSSLGTGALAAAIFVVMLLSYIMEGIKAVPKTLEDGTKIYEPVKHKYNVRLTMFSLFQFLAVGCTAIISALFAFGTGTYSTESVMLGRYTDNLAPFAIFLVLVYVFLYGIDLSKPIIGMGIYGYSCICFAVAGYPLTELSEQLTNTPLMGLFPKILGGENTASSGMNYIIMSSSVFTLYALIIVFISCTRRHRTSLVTGTVFCVIMSAAVYASVFYLPKLGQANSEQLAPYKDVMILLYNNPQSPPIITYDTDPQLAATIQFLAPDTHVSTLKKGEPIPESCLLIAENSTKITFKGGSYDTVGKTSQYTVYAFGETARDFISYSSANEKVPTADSPVMSRPDESSDVSESSQTVVSQIN